jgi:hypothetical protein
MNDNKKQFQGRVWPMAREKAVAPEILQKFPFPFNVFPWRRQDMLLILLRSFNIVSVRSRHCKLHSWVSTRELTANISNVASISSVCYRTKECQNEYPSSVQFRHH